MLIFLKFHEVAFKSVEYLEVVLHVVFTLSNAFVEKNNRCSRDCLQLLLLFILLSYLASAKLGILLLNLTLNKLLSNSNHDRTNHHIITCNTNCHTPNYISIQSNISRSLSL